MQIKTKIVRGHTADSKPVKQEVNGTVILSPLLFPAATITNQWNKFLEDSSSEMLSAVIVSGQFLIFMLSVIILSAIIRTVITLSGIILSVGAPENDGTSLNFFN